MSWTCSSSFSVRNGTMLLMEEKPSRPVTSERNAPFQTTIVWKERILLLNVPSGLETLEREQFYSLQISHAPEVQAEWFYKVCFNRLSNFPSLGLICDGKQNLSFFAPSRPPFSPRGVRCDFEIKAFYLTSVSDLTYFIYLQANYGQILLPEPISGSLRSPGWSEERTFVSYNVPPVRFGASKTIASTHYSQRGVEVAQDRDRPPPTVPMQGANIKALHGFNLCKCTMRFAKGTIDFIVIPRKVWSSFASPKDSIWYQQLHIISVLQIQ